MLQKFVILIRCFLEVVVRLHIFWKITCIKNKHLYFYDFKSLYFPILLCFFLSLNPCCFYLLAVSSHLIPLSSVSHLSACSVSLVLLFCTAQALYPGGVKSQRTGGRAVES